jgi:phosphate:Na+ symporter
METNLIILSVFGGILLLLYGVKLAGDGLQGWAGPRIKTALETMTKNRFAALFTGVVVTFLLQSSSAATVTVVSLIDAGLMSFAQAIGVILGSGIGTTITVQLISFKIHEFALFICGVGLMVMFISNDVQRKSAGRGIFGFGLIFLSIMLMSEALKPLHGNRLFMDIMQAVGGNPLLGIIIALAITAVVQSSAATIGIAITLSLPHPETGVGLITLESAVPIVLGANVGTCATAIISSIKSSTEAKRSAFAHMFFKVIGVLVILPLLGPFNDFIRLTSADVTRQIANAHAVFNIALSFILLPFTTRLALLIEKWFPEKTEDQEDFKAKYLNQTMLGTPSLALAQATRETMRMAEIAQDMLKMSLPALLKCDSALIDKIETMDDQVDFLDRSIRIYLTQMSKNQLTPEEAEHQMEILTVISNLEAIGDVVDKNILEQARKKSENCVQFSDDGRKDIEELHARVLENLELTVSAFATRNRALAERAYRNKTRIRDLEKKYYRRHIDRLESGLSESIETSSIHLDVLTNLKRINTHLTNIAYPLLQNLPQ